MNKLKIAIAGLGTVGASVINYIEQNKNVLEKRINTKIEIVGICAKEKLKKRSFKIDRYAWYNNPISMINSCKPNIYIELMGYEKGISYKSIIHAINNKTAVITANKALLSIHGNYIFNLAEKNNVKVLFEASVAGGIPIIKVIKDSLSGNKITKISAILNGTTNYILSNMHINNISFKKAFQEAQKKGYVESNPALDIEGIDSAHKLSILSTLSFNSKFIKFDKIYREGISKIEKIDIDYSKKLNLVIKLLSVVQEIKNKLILYVKPVMISNKSQLSKVNGVLNGIQINSSELGSLFLEGKGAGGAATASSIISDINEFCINRENKSLSINFKELTNKHIISLDNNRSSYYIRMIVRDKEGVLAKVTSLFKKNKISIESLIQNPENNDIIKNFIPLIFITHETTYKNIKNSISKIKKLKDIKDNPIVIQIDRV